MYTWLFLIAKHKERQNEVDKASQKKEWYKRNEKFASWIDSFIAF